jgi:hypothetical protein
MPEADTADCTALVSLGKESSANFSESMTYKLFNLNNVACMTLNSVVL